MIESFDRINAQQVADKVVPAADELKMKYDASLAIIESYIEYTKMSPDSLDKVLALANTMVEKFNLGRNFISEVEQAYMREHRFVMIDHKERISDTIAGISASTLAELKSTLSETGGFKAIL